jgi:hypothetical protein
LSEQILLVEESQVEQDHQITEQSLEQLKIKLLHNGDYQKIKAVSSIKNDVTHMNIITMFGGRASRVTRNSDHWSDVA